MGPRLRNSATDSKRQGLSLFILKRVKRGFTLTELLVAMLITGIVAGAAITVFSVFIFHFEQTDELTTAQQNGEMVLTILRNPVLHAGLALPASADELPDVFSPDLKPDPHLTGSLIDEFSGGSITVSNSLPDGGDPPGGNVLLVLYGIPSHFIAESSGDLNSPPVAINLSGKVNGNLDESPSNLTKAWALFPTAGVPARVTGIDPSGSKDKLTLVPVETGNGTIAAYDELYYLRGMRAFARKGDFYTEDLTLQAAQPRVENIAAVFFERRDSVLQVWVVAAGPKEHDKPVYDDWSAFTIAFPEWPGSSAFEDFDSGKIWKKHRLRVLSESWRIRN